MNREICLIEILFYLSFLLTFTNQTDEIYACPLEEGIVSRMVEYRYKILCNTAHADCLLHHEFHRDSYSIFIILLHDGDWSLIKNVTQHLSRCNVKYSLIDVNIVVNDFTISGCSASRTTIIFNLATDKLQEEQDVIFSNDDCRTKRFTEKSKLQRYISTLCQNTMWITGSLTCDNMTSYGEKILALNNEKDFISDKSLGKMYLNGKQLRLGMIANWPYYMETAQLTHRGILHNLLGKISANLNFTFIDHYFSYTVHYPEDGQYGGKLKNGAWSGMVGDLINNKTDVIFADLTVTFPRSEFIDFTLPYYFESIGILIRRPHLESKLWKMFLLFDEDLWAAILTTFILSSFFLFALHKFSSLEIDSPFNKLGECLWCMVSFYANQGSEYDPETWSVQNFLALLWLFVFAILSIYSGGLIAMLTSSHMVLPFKDLEGLSMAVKQGQFKVCVTNGTAFHTTLMAGAGLYGPIKNWLLQYPSYQTERINCIELLKKYTDVAFLEEITYLEGVQRDYCDGFNFILLSDKFFPGYFSIGLPKNSSLNGIFSEQLTKAVDAGLILGWKRNFTGEKLTFCHILQPDDVVLAESSNLSLPEFAGPFVLLAVGIAVSLVWFFYEIRRRLFCRTKKSKKEALLFITEHSIHRKRKRNNWIKY